MKRRFSTTLKIGLFFYITGLLSGVYLCTTSIHNPKITKARKAYQDQKPNSNTEYSNAKQSEQNKTIETLKNSLNEVSEIGSEAYSFAKLAWNNRRQSE